MFFNWPIGRNNVQVSFGMLSVDDSSYEFRIDVKKEDGKVYYFEPEWRDANSMKGIKFNTFEGIVKIIVYRRKKDKDSWIRETPRDRPRYLLVPVAEDEHIGGVELASLLRKARNMGLELLLSITDRETAITYYLLKQIIIPGSDYEYYEIEWMKP